MEDAVLIALIGSGTSLVVGTMTLAGVYMSNRKLAQVAKGVDGLTTARVDAEKELGDANAEIAEGRGRDTERAKGEARASALVEGAKVADSPAAPVEVKVVKSAPVDIKKSVPIELKGKKKP